MKWLIDTQCCLWMTGRTGRLSAPVREQLADPATTLFFSSASVWEISIKHATGKLRLPQAPSSYVASLSEFRLLPLVVTWEHAIRVGELPLHHRDPFDRLLIAQAQLERLPVLTADPIFARYDVELIAP